MDAQRHVSGFVGVLSLRIIFGSRRSSQNVIALENEGNLIGKMPYFTDADLWFDSEYPQPGEVECRVLSSSMPGIVRIALAEETTDGRSEVVVPETDITP